MLINADNLLGLIPTPLPLCVCAGNVNGRVSRRDMEVRQKSPRLTDISLSKQPLHLSLHGNPCSHSAEANSLGSGEPAHPPLPPLASVSRFSSPFLVCFRLRSSNSLKPSSVNLLSRGSIFRTKYKKSNAIKS